MRTFPLPTNEYTVASPPELQSPHELVVPLNELARIVGTYRLQVLPVPATLANQIDLCGYDLHGFEDMTPYAIKDIIGHKGKNQ